jgi:hypothetical protein
MKQSKSILAGTVVASALALQSTSGDAQSGSNGKLSSGEEIRPFKMARVPEKELDDLKRRILATRWPEKEPVNDQTQGVPLATMNGVKWKQS